LLALATAMGAPFKTNEERIPKEVKEIVNKQVKAYFGQQDFTGVPLLDPKIEWNDFANWPDEFTFRGETNSIRISEVGGDYIRKLKSRTEVKPGMRFLVTYYKKGSTEQGSLILYGCWLKNGSINEKWVCFHGQTVFLYKYYSSGRILDFTRVDYETKENRCDLFERSGEIVGFYIEASGKPAKYVWWGRKVDVDTFQKRQNRLFNNYQNK
jgi:hypothetical protein